MFVQNNLGNAASQSVRTLEKLKNQIKSAAAAMTSADRKEQLLTVCKNSRRTFTKAYSCDDGYFWTKCGFHVDIQRDMAKSPSRF